MKQRRRREYLRRSIRLLTQSLLASSSGTWLKVPREVSYMLASRLQRSRAAKFHSLTRSRLRLATALSALTLVQPANDWTRRERESLIGQHAGRLGKLRGARNLGHRPDVWRWRAEEKRRGQWERVIYAQRMTAHAKRGEEQEDFRISSVSRIPPPATTHRTGEGLLCHLPLICRRLILNAWDTA